MANSVDIVFLPDDTCSSVRITLSTHAIENNFATPEEVRALGQEQKELVSRMLEKLGLKTSYECTFASEYQSDPNYSALHSHVTSLNPDANHYFRYQWAGMAYLANHRGVRVKVGWLTDDDLEARHFDERRFDQGYNELGLSPLSYVYLKCGRNFAPGRGRVSPYTSVEGEERIMLKPGEDARSCFDEWVFGRKISKDTRQTLLHLAHIVTAFDELFDGILGGAESVWSNAPENLSCHIVGVPNNTQEVRGLEIKSIHANNLADKINTIMTDVFGLGPTPCAHLKTRRLLPSQAP